MRPLRCSARVSSRIARRDTTILPRRRSILRIWNGCGRSISGPTSRTGRMSTWLPGRKATAPPRSTVKPPLTRPKITPSTRLPASNSFSSLSHAASRRARSRDSIASPARILDAVDIDFDLVADLEFGLLARRGELAQRHAAFALQADVDHREVVLDPGDDALDDLAFEGFVLAAEAFVEQRREIVAGRKCRGRHKYVCLSVLIGPAAWPPPWRAFTCGPGCMHCRQRHHAERGVFGVVRGQPTMTKSAFRCRLVAGDTARARQRDGLPRGRITARRTARALA